MGEWGRRGCGGECSSRGSEEWGGPAGWEEGAGEKSKGGRGREGEGSSAIEVCADLVRRHSPVRLVWGVVDLVLGVLVVSHL